MALLPILAGGFVQVPDGGGGGVTWPLLSTDGKIEIDGTGVGSTANIKADGSANFYSETSIIDQNGFLTNPTFSLNSVGTLNRGFDSAIFSAFLSDNSSPGGSAAFYTAQVGNYKIVDVGLNTSNLPNHDSGSIGGIFRLEARPSEGEGGGIFTVRGIPVGGGEQEVFSVELTSGNVTIPIGHLALGPNQINQDGSVSFANGQVLFNNDGSAYLATGQMIVDPGGNTTVASLISNDLSVSAIVLTDTSKKLISGTTNTLVAVGVPVVVDNQRYTAQTAAKTFTSFATSASDNSYEISMNVLITTATLHSFTATVSYTDEGNTARIVTLQFSTLAGAFITAMTNAQGAVPYEGVILHIRCKASTNITFATVGTFTTVAYNVEGNIKQIS